MLTVGQGTVPRASQVIIDFLLRIAQCFILLFLDDFGRDAMSIHALVLLWIPALISSG